MNPSKQIRPVAALEKPLGRGGPLSRWQISLLAVLLVSLSLFLSVFLTGQSHFSAPAYQPGDIARADIIIPMDLFIEDEAATQAHRAEAKNHLLPVYRFNPSLQEEQASRLKEAFSHSRNLLKPNPPGKESSGESTRGLAFRTLPTAVKVQLRSTLQHLGINPPVDDLLVFLVREGFSSKLENQITALLKDLFPTLPVYDDRRLTGARENIHKLNIVTGKMETVPVAVLTTITQLRNNLGRQIQEARLAASSRPHLRRILEGLIIPNLTFDESLTKSRAEEELKNIDHVLRKLKKGKVVLRQGDEVGQDHLVQIEAIRKLSLTGSSMVQTTGMALLIGILLTIFLFFVHLFSLSQWSYLRLVLFLMLTLTANILLLKVSWFVFGSVSQSFLASPFNDNAYFFYLLPFACGSMLISLLAGERCAQLFILFFSILAGQAIQTDFYGFFYILITNLTGIIFMRKATQRIGLIEAGVKLGLFAAFLFLILQTLRQAPPDLIGGGFGAALAFLSGLANIIFLVFAIPLCERIFMVTTEIRLSELGNLNLPFVRDMMIKTPGTYNHSIAVGTLCEGAAKTIGLNPLFLRTASLYHDVGKTLQPGYFVENQHGANPHDQLSPEESVRILQEHVLEGVRIAQKEYLPPSIVDLIPQHHGTKLIRFFFEKAQKQAAASGTEVREEEYRYSGPKPQTKAAAILMLADGIEAAARTLGDHSQHNLLDLIRKIIADTTEDGQLSECDITLSEMNRITYSFLETLSSYYHGRIAYPGFDFNPFPAEGNRPD